MTGLSDTSRWREAYTQTPLRADSPEAIASVFGTYLGPGADGPLPGGDPAP
ncbi:hypothetical protein RMN57_13270 [Kitasatospora sp. CM 4170]|uniref:Uncharacterized protein n=1 Tax=Kitasatospora aburaviensis TaxID=67265 RepID=A0ABW1ESH2_9ACTN|nr:hypothetical protein [Kitasatospora sp. CM 4170]WNM45624.1 hypothetical protein RMN57_13270 [Kitasatospora sp. CM 4170]